MSQNSANAEIAQLAAKIEKVRQERVSLERRAADLQAKITCLRQSEVELGNELHRARIQPSATHLLADKLLTRRSIGVWKAWAALDRALSNTSDGAGLANHVVQRAILEALPGAPPSTIRSYLHRFKQQGLIKQAGSHWQLADRTETLRLDSATGDQNA